jgi:hypothetical protein
MAGGAVLRKQRSETKAEDFVVDASVQHRGGQKHPGGETKHWYGHPSGVYQDRRACWADLRRGQMDKIPTENRCGKSL